MAEPNNDTLLLPFQVGPYCFCVDAIKAEAIIEMPSALTSVPLGEESIIGVFLYHDSVAKVISLRRKFGLEETHNTERKLVILSNMESGLTGFCVDSVSEIISTSDICLSELSGDINITVFRKFVLKDDTIMMFTEFEILLMIEDVPLSSYPYQLDVDSDSHGSELAAVLTEQTEEPVTVIETPAPHVPENRIPDSKEQPFSKESYASPGNDKPLPTQNVSCAPLPAGKPHQHAVRNIQPHIEMKIKGTHSFDYMKNHSVQKNKIKQHSNYIKDYVKVSSSTTAAQQQTNSYESREKNKIVPILAGFFVLGAIFVLAIFFRLNIAEKTMPVTKAYKPVDPITKQEKLLYKNSQKASHRQRDINTEKQSLPEPERPRNTQPVNEAEICIPKDNDVLPYAKQQSEKEVKIMNEDNGTFAIETKDFSIIVERPPKIDENITVTEIPELDRKEMVYSVVKGDTLWDIAKHYLGDPFRYMILAEVSRIQDPDLIYPNDRIYIIMKNAQKEN